MAGRGFFTLVAFPTGSTSPSYGTREPRCTSRPGHSAGSHVSSDPYRCCAPLPEPRARVGVLFA